MGGFSISINVADRPYRLMIDKENEETFRKAAKLVDDRIKTYSNNYAYKDKQDLVAMVALEQTIHLLEHERTASEKEANLAKRLIEIDSALNEILTEQSLERSLTKS
jgi:cell division protein ZapA (FtsZ GTPase activity inhibitor)